MIYIQEHRQRSSNNCLHASLGESRTLKEPFFHRTSGKFTAERNNSRKIPQPASCVAHNRTSKIQRSISVVFYPLTCLFTENRKRYSTQQQAPLSFWYFWRWVRTSDCSYTVHPREPCSHHCSLYPITHGLLFLLKSLLPAPVSLPVVPVVFWHRSHSHHCYPHRCYHDTLWCHPNHSCNLPPLFIIRVVVFLEHLLQLF